MLADIRSRPASRFAPQFNRKALEASLAKASIAYSYLGDTLGGRARSDTSGTVAMDLETRQRDPAFRAGFARLLEEAAGRRVAIMCAEKDPAGCHRSFLVGRALM
jgi:uncharacterized protein (DUF488 family)